MERTPNVFASLETGRLLLRRLTVADAASFFRIYQNSETMRFMDSPPRSVADEEQHIERQIAELYQQGVGLLAVTLKEDQACRNASRPFSGDLAFPF